MPVHGQKLLTSKRRGELLLFLADLGPGDECFPWPGRTTGKNASFMYGTLRVGGKIVAAHRWVYESLVGSIPDGEKVCHRCDNPPCVRPDHLFTGTQKVNIQDAVSKGRMASGERSGRAKVSDAEVERIRALRVAGVKLKPIAEAFGLSESHVANITKGRFR